MNSVRTAERDGAGGSGPGDSHGLARQQVVSVFYDDL